MRLVAYRMLTEFYLNINYRSVCILGYIVSACSVSSVDIRWRV